MIIFMDKFIWSELHPYNSSPAILSLPTEYDLHTEFSTNEHAKVGFLAQRSMAGSAPLIQEADPQIKKLAIGA